MQKRLLFLAGSSQLLPALGIKQRALPPWELLRLNLEEGVCWWWVVVLVVL